MKLLKWNKRQQLREIPLGKVHVRKYGIGISKETVRKYFTCDISETEVLFDKKNKIVAFNFVKSKHSYKTRAKIQVNSIGLNLKSIIDYLKIKPKLYPIIFDKENDILFFEYEVYED